jgi:hypothetical protein
MAKTLVGGIAGKMRLAGVIIIVLCIGNWNVAVHGLSSSSSVVRRPTMPSVLDVEPASLVSPQHWKELHLNGWVVIPDYATNDQVELLKFDAQRLEYDGFADAAGTSNKNQNSNSNSNSNSNHKNDDTVKTPRNDEKEKEKPHRLCQHAWLVDDAGSVNSFNGKITTHRTFLGPPYVSQCIANLEESLDGMSPYYDASDSIYQNDYNIMPCESEAAYLYYQPGGYYQPHFDTPSRKATTTASRQKKHRRGFSFLLYLGGGAVHDGNQLSNKKRASHKDQSEPWSAEDGGALKMYNPPLPLEDQQKRVSGQGCNDPDTTRGFKNIYPVAGSLVVFKSEAICHEVLETHRARLALVGWIHTNIPNT